MLVLVVGASGAGKDTLIEAAAMTLRGDDRFRFVRRVVTRPVMEGGEQHETVTEEEFERRLQAGVFALQWHAHGLRYALPARIAADLDEGRVVVANISRAVIADAASLFPVRVVEITAPTEVRAARLEARGREDKMDVIRRLSRAIVLPLPVQRDTIVNDGTVEDGANRLIEVLSREAGRARLT